ncbi:hypothetical protein [Labrys neptuniae]
MESDDGRHRQIDRVGTLASGLQFGYGLGMLVNLLLGSAQYPQLKAMS